jgi:transposase, IS6 family
MQPDRQSSSGGRRRPSDSVCRALGSSLLARAPRCEELRAEHGLAVDHTTIWRWVQDYVPALEQRLRRQLKSTNKSWRGDETYIRVQGAWCYLYRAIDSSGATIDFLLAALRDAAAAQRLFRQALREPSHPQPRVINTDKAPALRRGACQRASGRHPAPPLPPATGPILGQHLGAGSSRDQTRAGQAGLSRVPRSPANDCGRRGTAHAPQRPGAVGQRR